MSRFVDSLHYDPPPRQRELDFRFFGHEGVPLEGSAAELTHNEYTQLTRRTGVAGFGVFDISDPEQKHFNRTLKDVYDAAATGEFKIDRLESHWVDQPDGQPPKMYYAIAWLELRDITNDEATKRAKRRAKERSEPSTPSRPGDRTTGSGR